MDKCRFPPTLWRALRVTGLEPAAVLRVAALPLDTDRFYTTAELFAVWKAVEQIANDPAFALRLLDAVSQIGHQPSFLAALYAADFRDAIHRIERFKRLGSCEHFWVTEQDGWWTLGKDWPYAMEPEPALSVDLSFLFLVELGRRGTGRRLVPAEIHITGVGNLELENHFGCPIRDHAERNQIRFASQDLELRFPGHSPEFLELVTPALAAAFHQLEVESALSDRVKAHIKRALASGRPNLPAVARDLDVSERTLQRRITAEGSSFRELLQQARQEMGRQLLADPELAVAEIACLLGYQDETSFYRAFRELEGKSPREWRLCALSAADTTFRPSIPNFCPLQVRPGPASRRKCRISRSSL